MDDDITAGTSPILERRRVLRLGGVAVAALAATGLLTACPSPAPGEGDGEGDDEEGQDGGGEDGGGEDEGDDD